MQKRLFLLLTIATLIMSCKNQSIEDKIPTNQMLGSNETEERDVTTIKDNKSPMICVTDKLNIRDLPSFMGETIGQLDKDVYVNHTGNVHDSLFLAKINGTEVEGKFIEVMVQDSKLKGWVFSGGLSPMKEYTGEFFFEEEYSVSCGDFCSVGFMINSSEDSIVRFFDDLIMDCPSDLMIKNEYDYDLNPKYKGTVFRVFTIMVSGEDEMGEYHHENLRTVEIIQ